MPAIHLVEQEFVAHLFAPLDGPDTDLALRQLAAVWRECREQLGMVNAIYGTDLPADLPADLKDAPEQALAGQQDQAVNFQAILRREHDVLNFSLVMATPVAPQQGLRGRTRLSAATPPGWREYARWWRALTAGGVDAFLGGAMIFQAKSPVAAQADVRGEVAPERDDATEWWTRPATLDDFTVWEVTAGGDQALRRLVVVGRPDEDARLSRFTWSAGDVALPPLGRYLMHAGKLRYQARVLGNGSEVARLRDRVVARLERITVLLGDPARAEALADEAAVLAADEAEVLGTLQALRSLDRTVEIARENMTSALPGELPTDARLAPVLAQRIADETFYLDQVRERSEQTRRLLPAATRVPARSILTSPTTTTRTAVRGSGVQQRMGFGVDVVKYSDRTTPQQSEVQRRLAGIFERVLADIGVSLEESDRQDAGDGMMVVLPAKIQPPDVLPGLLNSWLSRVVGDNAAHPEDRIRLRLAVTAGPFSASAIGFAGATIIETGRLLDSAVLRQAIVDHPHADLVALVSDRLHADVVGEGYPGLDAAHFEPMQVRVKSYAKRAWLWLGGGEPAEPAGAGPAEASGAEPAEGVGAEPAGPADEQHPRSAELGSSSADAPSQRDIFVIYGDAERARTDLFEFLRAIELSPLEWEQLVARTGEPAPRREDVLRQAFVENTAAVVLIAPIAGASLIQSEEVLIATGMALALYPLRTVLVRLGGARLPEPLVGRDAVHLDSQNHIGRYHLAERLRRLGYAVNTEGTDWLDPRLFKDY